MSPRPRSRSQAAGPARVLVLGSGGREHALAWSLAREADVQSVIVAPGSQAIDEERKVRCVPDVSPLDPTAVLAVARSEKVDLVVVGPEAPLAAGVADPLVKAKIPCFGPVQAAARIESSKSFCRDVAAAAKVRMARGGSFAELEPALEFAASLVAARGSRGVVVKADGLAAGKGVTVCDDLAGAEKALRALFADLPDGGAAGGGGEAQPAVVLEERLVGLEASLIAICDGRNALALPAARDHKRLLDGDEGPNTGGMGAYSPVPDIPESLSATLLETIHEPVLAELARRGTPFRGALYAGLMLTPEGPVLLEFNARFGDPEAQAVLPRLSVPLGPLLLAAAKGNLAAAASELRLRSMILPTTGDAAVAVVLAAAGYPEKPRKGDVIDGLDEAARAGATIFHAGTVQDDEGRYRTNGGRVMAVVGLGSSLAAARAEAERAADKVRWDGMQRRHDIAARLPAAASESAAQPISPGWAAAEERP
jgi:phosphoribosylamine--glycine ligase